MDAVSLPEGLRLRPYQAADLAGVVQFVSNCYVRAKCPWMHPGDVLHCMSNLLRGQRHAEHFHLCEDPAGTLAALVMLYPARYSGFELIMQPARRGGALERALIDWGEAASWCMMRAAGNTSPIGVDAGECDPVRRDALAAAGYTTDAAPHTLYNTRSLNEPIPESVLPDGFTIRSVVGESDAEQLGVAHGGAFGSSWTAEEYRRVIRTPGFHPDRELVVVAPDGRLAAFLVYWVDALSGKGLFEPVGCHRDFQRRGLTRALLYEGLRRMKAHGMETAVVKNFAASEAAGGVYRSAGFAPQYGIFLYQKQMV